VPSPLHHEEYSRRGTCFVVHLKEENVQGALEKIMRPQHVITTVTFAGPRRRPRRHAARQKACPRAALHSTVATDETGRKRGCRQESHRAIVESKDECVRPPSALCGHRPRRRRLELLTSMRRHGLARQQRPPGPIHHVNTHYLATDDAQSERIRPRETPRLLQNPASRL